MEKRKYKRVKNNAEVNIITNVDLDEVKIESGKSRNVSASGVLLEYNQQLDLGSKIKVKFLFPDTSEIFESNARITRVEMSTDNENLYDIGIEFINLSENDEAKLDVFLQSDEHEKDYCFIELEIP